MGMKDSLGKKEYLTLASRADAFFTKAITEAPDAFQCGRGCSQCCHTGLSVLAAEADELRAFLAERPALRQELKDRTEKRGDRDPRCIMLNDEDACDVYEARPIVCRTQGLALLHPAGALPEDAVMARTAPGADGSPPLEVTWCPLNYTTESPRREHVLDVMGLTVAHLNINHAYATDQGTDPRKRTPLYEIAVE